MILYNDNCKKVTFNRKNKIGEGEYGKVYRISETECIKVYEVPDSVQKHILDKIKRLNLKNYYEIHDFYQNNKGKFKAYTMKYYQNEEIDILTLPTEYTLDNLFRIQRSVETLTQNNISITDTHSENIIKDSNNITIIDTDLYEFNNIYTKEQLERKNMEKLAYLFGQIFIDAICDHHSEYQAYNTAQVIRKTFEFYTPTQIEEVYRKLSKYEHPIDYIKMKTKRKIF